MEILLLQSSDRLLSSKRVGKVGAHSWRVTYRILVLSTVCYTAGFPMQRLGEVCVCKLHALCTAGIRTVEGPIVKALSEPGM